MNPRPFPQKVESPAEGIAHEAYSRESQLELWQYILSGRENPKRKGIWPGMQSFEALKTYLGSEV